MFKKKRLSSAMIVVGNQNHHYVVGKLSPFLQGFIEACFEGAEKHNQPVRPGIYNIVMERHGIKFQIVLQSIFTR